MRSEGLDINLVGLVSFYEEEETQRSEDTARAGHLQARKLAFLRNHPDAPYSYTYNLLKCKKINSCGLSHLICGVLLCHPSNNNT